MADSRKDEEIFLSPFRDKAELAREGDCRLVATKDLSDHLFEIL